MVYLVVFLSSSAVLLFCSNQTRSSGQNHFEDYTDYEEDGQNHFEDYTDYEEEPVADDEDTLVEVEGSQDDYYDYFEGDDSENDSENDSVNDSVNDCCFRYSEEQNYDVKMKDGDDHDDAQESDESEADEQCKDVLEISKKERLFLTYH